MIAKETRKRLSGYRKRIWMMRPIPTSIDMKLIIAGSRTIHPDTQFILQKMNELNFPFESNVTEIVSGGAIGVDRCGEQFARDVHLPVTQFKPDYKMYAGRAPLVRNAKMAAYADILLLIWNGRSSGSADMKNKMKLLNKPIYEVIVQD